MAGISGKWPKDVQEAIKEEKEEKDKQLQK
jgi:hypothetical protein